MTRVLYLIEVQDAASFYGEPRRWTPIYAPCYTLEEAREKQVIKARTFGSERVRISKWIRDGIIET